VVGADFFQSSNFGTVVGHQVNIVVVLANRPATRVPLGPAKESKLAKVVVRIVYSTDFK
jgi:hypothetical protein